MRIFNTQNILYQCLSLLICIFENLFFQNLKSESINILEMFQIEYLYKKVYGCQHFHARIDLWLKLFPQKTLVSSIPIPFCSFDRLEKLCVPNAKTSRFISLYYKYDKIHVWIFIWCFLFLIWINLVFGIYCI